METSTLKRKKISREANYPRRYPSELKLVKTIGTLSEQGIAELKISYSRNPLECEQIIISNSRTAANAFRTIFKDIEYRESAYVILLSRTSEIIGFYLLSIGDLTSCVIDPKIVFQAALLANASNIIIAHNHPSGNLIASNNDYEITSKIKAAGKFLDLQLLDHIIITRDSYYSFADAGIL